MFNRLVVPVDGSDRSWHAVTLASAIADICDASVEIVQVVNSGDSLDAAVASFERAAEQHGAADCTMTVLSGNDVASAISELLDQAPGSMAVLSSTGRGRSAAVLGSVASELLEAMFGPIVVVGPNVGEIDSFTGDLVVPVDGSELSESALGIAAAWGIGFGATPWVVEVLSEDVGVPIALESSYVARLAKDLEAASRRDVQYEVLHGRQVGKAISEFADARDARLVVMSTHGRTGLERFTMGSTAADVVRSAHCPVVLNRPPRFAAGASG